MKYIFALMLCFVIVIVITACQTSIPLEPVNSIQDKTTTISSPTQTIKPQVAVSQENKMVKTNDYEISLYMNRINEFCSIEAARMNWCDHKNYPAVEFVFNYKPINNVGGGSSNYEVYIFNENGQSIRLLGTGEGGGFDWKEGWSNYFSYPVKEFKSDLPKTVKLYIFYDWGTNLHGKSLQELSSSQNKFVLNYSTVEALLTP